MRDFRFSVLGVAAACLAAPVCMSASQRQIAELKPIATFTLGKTADWVAVTADAVWVASSGPFAVNRIGPETNTRVASVQLPGEACAGLAVGAQSLWVPQCTKKPSLAKVDLETNKVIAIFPVGPPAEEGGIAFGANSVGLIIDKLGSLARIDPANVLSGSIWLTHAEGADVTAIDAATGKVNATVATGPKPRFLTTGAGAVWTLNQGDGTLTRIDAGTHAALTISLGTLGPGGDSLSLGHGSLWLTDYYKGSIERIPIKDVLAHCPGSPPGTPGG